MDTVVHVYTNSWNLDAHEFNTSIKLSFSNQNQFRGILHYIRCCIGCLAEVSLIENLHSCFGLGSASAFSLCLRPVLLVKRLFCHHLIIFYSTHLIHFNIKQSLRFYYYPNVFENSLVNGLIGLLS